MFGGQDAQIWNNFNEGTVYLGIKDTEGFFSDLIDTRDWVI